MNYPNGDLTLKWNLFNRKNTENNHSVLYFIFTFFFILSTDSFWTYTWTNRILFNVVNLLMAFGIVVSAMLILMRSKRLYVARNGQLLIAQIVGLLACMFINIEVSGGFVIKLSLAMIGFMFSTMLDFDKIAKAVVRVMTFLSIWSLMLYVMKLVEVIDVLPIVKNTGGMELYNGIFGFMPVHGDRIPRNWGIFWEPGATIVYVTFALILDLFYFKDKKPFKFMLFALTILTTFSTTGIICLGLVMLTYLFFSGFKRVNIVKLFVAAALVGGTILIFSSDKIFTYIFGKLDFDNITQSASFGARYYSIVGNIKLMFTDGIFFGVGVDGYDNIYKQTVIGMGYNLDFGNTNTYFVDLARFGWLYGACNFVLTYELAKKIGANKPQKWCIFVTILIMLFMENLSYSLFWMTMPYLALNREEQFVPNKKFVNTIRRKLYV